MLRLHDTLTRAVEPIVPSAPGRLRLYTCGPTVYRDQHLGNMRTFLLGDLIARFGRLAGWQVDWVVNITDVGHVTDDSVADAGEDKLAGQARAEGISIASVARRVEAGFHADLAALNIGPATAYPRASDYIDRMIALVSLLLEKGNAYVGGDATVYFDARSYPGYGELSGNRLAALRVSQDDEALAAKRFHADWALWKATAPDAPVVFDSPWGPGFPGWHVECSAMSDDLLGEVIDIHTGGVDLRFPHHEDERAQTESAAGHQVVRHWVHGEHLLFEGRKMAKSTGNAVRVADVVAAGLDPLAVRLAFLRYRYRQQVGLDWDALRAADRQLRRWRERVARWSQAPGRPMHPPTRARVIAALEDDLDTPAAVIALQELEADPAVADGAKFETFNHLDRVLGLDLQRSLGASEPAVPEPAQVLLAARADARTARDWATADSLRDQLAALGVEVSDTPDGQVARLR